MGVGFDRASGVVPKPVKSTAYSGGFWRKEEPVVEDGQITQGGMWPTQRAWWEGTDPIKVFLGGYGAGKTFIGGKRIISLALENSGCPVGAVSPTFPMARQTIIPTIMELLAGKQSHFNKMKWVYNKTTHEFRIDFKGRTGIIYIYSGENPKTLKGANLASIWLDEPFIMDREVYTQMIARLRHPQAQHRELFLTGCVTPDTRVFGEGGARRIGDYDPGTKPKEYADIDEQILGIGNDYHQATKFYNNGVDDTMVLELSTGATLQATPDHPVLVLGQDGMPVFKRLGEREGKYAHLEQLHPDDWVAVARGMDVWGTKDPCEGFVAPEVAGRWADRQMTTQPKMTKDFAYFCGLWVAEGSFHAPEDKFTITCGDEGVVDSLVDNGVMGFPWRPMASRGDQARCVSKQLAALFRHIGMPMVKAPEKWVPDWVWRGRRKWAVQFLSGAWDGDGHVCKNGQGIGITTTSYELAKDYQDLMLNLGVVSRIDGYLNPPTEKVPVESYRYQVVAFGQNAQKLARILKLRVKRKRKQLKHYKSKQYRDSDIARGTGRFVVEAWEARTKQRWRKRPLVQARSTACGKNSHEPNKIAEAARKGQDIAYSGVADFLAYWDLNEPETCPAIEALRTHLNNGYHWASIKRLLPGGKAETVDFVIPDTHSFVCGGGLHSRNTPEELGWGYKLCKEPPAGRTVGLYIGSTRENKALPEDYVAELLANMSEEAARAYVDGEFVNLTEGRVYYAFDDNENVIEMQRPKGSTLGVGIDFNVNPMSAVVFWYLNDHMHVIKEYELKRSDTELMAQTLREDWGAELIEAYPDATGARKQTSGAGKSDFTYLKDWGFKIKAPFKNPLRKDRWNAVNGKLKPAEGSITLTIDPSCKKLIEYLSVYSHNLMNKQEHMSHLTDALGYPVHRLFGKAIESYSKRTIVGI